MKVNNNKELIEEIVKQSVPDYALDDDVEYYRHVLEQITSMLCLVMGVETDHYDRDQADGACYLDCARDAALKLEALATKDKVVRVSDIEELLNLNSGMMTNKFMIRELLATKSIEVEL